MILEKTHRVFRVIEINQSLEDFPKFWDWLHEVKMPELSRAALCPPACQRLDLPKAVTLLSTIAGSCFFLGVVTCALEFHFHPGMAME
ncbi:sperm-egg fusion protein TMEM95 isoform X2 [Heteronotia binoei]|uniref:sperm-egg fusion protein TMEM95 isoform X2 n=1 Tax=Heteronotia binoei TaxID=13085 RepID=UPI00292CF59D|nr:sperm-egg fusion protein TMEM95 isoform X2 [Heteronotia binoei]